MLDDLYPLIGKLVVWAFLGAIALAIMSVVVLVGLLWAFMLRDWLVRAGARLRPKRPPTGFFPVQSPQPAPPTATPTATPDPALADTAKLPTLQDPTA